MVSKDLCSKKYVAQPHEHHHPPYLHRCVVIIWTQGLSQKNQAWCTDVAVAVFELSATLCLWLNVLWAVKRHFTPLIQFLPSLFSWFSIVKGIFLFHWKTKPGLLGNTARSPFYAIFPYLVEIILSNREHACCLLLKITFNLVLAAEDIWDRQTTHPTHC